jgi:hypothetical protein
MHILMMQDNLLAIKRPIIFTRIFLGKKECCEWKESRLRGGMLISLSLSPTHTYTHIHEKPQGRGRGICKCTLRVLCIETIDTSHESEFQPQDSTLLRPRRSFKLEALPSGSSV